MVSGVSAQSTVGVLGTPSNGSTVSGVSVISGYHCTSKDIEVFIDGVSYGKAGAGTQILGTQSVCGRTDTGYSFLYNFSNLANGQHTVSVMANGIPFATNTITTVKSGGEQFLTGASKRLTIPDFPHAGQAANVEWVQSYQNFMITGIGNTANDMSNLNGSFGQHASISLSGSSCSAYGFLTGNIQTVVSAAASLANPNVIALYLVPDTYTDICLLVMNRISGDSGTGYGLNGSGQCDSTNWAIFQVSAKNVKKAADGKRLLGTVTSFFPGCTHTAVLY